MRQHQDPDHQDDEELAAGEAVLRERHRREEREHHRGADGDEDDDQAVLDDLPEVRARHRVAEVLEGRREREPGGLRAVDLLVRLERGRDHPVDGEDEHDEDRDPEEIPGAAPEEAPASPASLGGPLEGRGAHAASSMRTILRT